MNLYKIKTLLIILLMFSSCAKPTVINVTKKNDNNLECKELDLEMMEAKNFKKEAKMEKDGTGGNLARMILFWPALATTFHNSDKAIQAADSRIYHLTLLQKKRGCESTNSIESSSILMSKTITEERHKLLCNYGVFNPPECSYKIIKNQKISITQELKELEKLRKDGVINDLEFKKGKKIILNQK
jgi:hypothetical protein